MSTDVRRSSGAAQRIADTLMKVMGGMQVSLRLTQTPALGDAGQVGMPGMVYQDYPMQPALYRQVWPAVASATGENTWELLVSASAVSDLLAATSVADALTLFASATGVVVDGTVRRISAVSTAEAFGAVYLYRLQLGDL